MTATIGSCVVALTLSVGPGDGPPQHLEVPDDAPGRPAAPGAPSAVTGNPTVTLGPWVSVQVNVDASGANIAGDAANEPSIAIDQTNPDVAVIGWRQFDTISSNFRQAGMGYSHDGGVTWTFPGVLEPGIFRSDPVLDADPFGNIYYFSLSSITGDLLCQVFVSDDGGLTWSDPIEAFGGDKAWYTVDQSVGVGEGNLYSAWSTAGNSFFPAQFTRSTTGGLLWDDPLEIVPENPRPIWGTLTVDGSGNLFISGQRGGVVYIIRSLNAMFPEELPVFEAQIAVDMGGEFVAFGDPNPGGLNGQVWVAADRSGGPTDGNVYLLASINPDGSDPMDVMFARSEDGGLTWSDPVRVNDDPADSGSWQWFGTMSVAPTGRIDAVWNDTRDSGEANTCELRYAYSVDAGDTWRGGFPVSPMYDSHVGWPNQNKMGDYYDMVSDAAEARLAWAATFNGEQDVYYLELGDCNGNGVHDGVDICEGDSADVDGNWIPDECECPTDTNGDGATDVTDVTAVILAWGTGDPAADVNGDGTVDVLDLTAVILAWGPC